MSVIRKKKFWVAAVVCGSGMVFQYLPTGCNNYWAAAGATSLDMCSILNCTGGTFFNMCEPVPLLMDCPSIQQAQAGG